MSFITKKAVQQFAKSKGMQVSGDFYGALDKKIEKLLAAAGQRCKDNKRKTLKPYDL
jgi:histone H3/H4